MNTTTRNDLSIPLEIVADAVEEIERHAAEAYPDECCGALLARGGRIVEAFRLPNTTAAGARRRFRIGPSDYLAAEERASDIGGTLAGFYHSHPDHPARPSPHDLEQAWPHLTYAIVSVAAGKPGELTAWRLRSDRSSFDRTTLRSVMLNRDV
jgi:proteasome lid subunit RPN8/RPN11